MSQPLEAYPNPVMRSQPTSSNSNGSFGPVFIVLAVILVVSAVACVLGRLCSRRHHRGKEVHHHHNPKANNNKQSHGGLGPKEWESRQKPSFNMRDGDIEFGFDVKRMPSAKMANHGGGKGVPPHHNGAGHKPEVRFADNV
ncbi:uncharacterized protein LOC105156608 [Sesamum indicum]|uniref:Uncharacterized protein LOC105156608 n=1 Tax=Sesamum indicum TaxID=4182 RepID=A0A6I9SUS5_SESIN|nr:uncharacterized protein LOC105156608 [Sesamum indicum]